MSKQSGANTGQNPPLDSSSTSAPASKKARRSTNRATHFSTPYKATQPHTVANEVHVMCLVASDNELEAVCTALEPQYRSFVCSKYMCYFGLLTTDAKSLTVLVTKPKQQGAVGPDGSQQILNDILRRVRTALVVSVGVAMGAFQEIHQINDVLVSTSVISYEVMKGSKINRNRRYPVDGVLKLACEEAMDNSAFPVHVGALASGDKLVTEEAQKAHILDVVSDLANADEDVIGGEMEGMGVYGACTASNIPWVIVKGVCDHGDNKEQLHKSKEEKKLIQIEATKQAVQFVRKIVAVYKLQFVDTNHLSRQKCVRVTQKDEMYPLLANFFRTYETQANAQIADIQSQLDELTARKAKLMEAHSTASKDLAKNWSTSSQAVSTEIAGRKLKCKLKVTPGNVLVSRDRLGQFMGRDDVDDYLKRNRSKSKRSVNVMECEEIAVIAQKTRHPP